MSGYDTIRSTWLCEHRDEHGDLWQYVEHEGKTWNGCRSCGLLELWEGGLFVRATHPALDALETEHARLEQHAADMEKAASGMSADLSVLGRELDDLREHADGVWLSRDEAERYADAIGDARRSYLAHRYDEGDEYLRVMERKFHALLAERTKP